MLGAGTGTLMLNDSLALAQASGSGTKGNAALKKIDRQALVARHKIVIEQPNSLNPLSVGNGEFGYTADITGLQTFPDFYSGGIGLGTMAQWAWHTTPDDHNYKLSDTFNEYESHGRKVPYPSGNEGAGGFGDNGGAAGWLNANPHRFDLGRIGLILPLNGDKPIAIGDLTDNVQELDLWTGVLASQFTVAGEKVKVETVAHPTRDLVAIRVTSPLVRDGLIGARLHFPFAPPSWLSPGDWNNPDGHTTVPTVDSGEHCFSRVMQGTTETFARAASSAGAKIHQVTRHEYSWMAPGQNSLTLVVAFAPQEIQEKLPNFQQVRQASVGHWKEFWSTGGAIDLSESTDPRWKELERRIVLSQFQTAINCSGSLPPQETGLVQNSWFGKFHLEMHWWHAAHFTQWGREDMLQRSMDYYRRILPVARETASRIGCKGARWPKMVGPNGIESPNFINPFLTWQQPHPVHMAELLYQARPTRETLDFFKDIVLESCEFMASYPWWNEERKCFELGPPSVAAYENNFPHRRVSKNPTFDLAYWSWAIGIGQLWRERLGMTRSEQWDHVSKNMAPLAIVDGVYRETETVDTGDSGHPTMLGAWGITPKTYLVDPAVMQKTLDHVLTKWPRNDMWGWDYPMMAMAAARLGRPDQAIESILLETDKNNYLPNGHNIQQLPVLPLYLPGNGGLLFAVALMAAGWSGSPDTNAPGFPTPAQGWTVRHEGLRKAL
ncbi:hypothetical protein EON80_13650 [bacterium]|nr:MAG: hypothetical protein EON80_13650 [bacterium]